MRGAVDPLIVILNPMAVTGLKIANIGESSDMLTFETIVFHTDGESIGGFRYSIVRVRFDAAVPSV